MKLKTLKDAPIKKGSRVILRVDFNVSLDGSQPEDILRINQAIPTINYLLKKGAHLRIVSHLGRPDGKKVKKFSTRPIAVLLAKLLKRKVLFAPDVFSKEFWKKYNNFPGNIFFENIRFWPGEEKNDVKLAAALARWGDIYVNEAFSNSHRRHASIVAITKYLPSFAGPNFEKEVLYLTKILKNPPKPLVAILGGAKLETKLPLVRNFLSMGAKVVVGGAIANSFLFAKGFAVGKSFVDKKMLKRLGIFGLLKNKRLYLPVDLRAAKRDFSSVRVLPLSGVKADEFVFDVGPKTAGFFGLILKSARTIVWNGPLGLIERPEFSQGTLELARRIRKIKALKVVGGGDSIAVLQKYKILSGFSHISTGGGAMLEFLAGQKLPGVEVLKK